MRQCAHERQVYFVEAPQIGSWSAHLTSWRPQPHLTVVVPHLPNDLPASERGAAQQALLLEYLRAEQCDDYALWYTTPLALAATRDLRPLAVVYDCHHTTDADGDAPIPSDLLHRQAIELLSCADLVFTDGQQAYQAKRLQHGRVFLFPGSVDAAHFARARQRQPEPDDQRALPHPRIGYFGALDTRLNASLLAALAAARPSWNFILMGPVVDRDPHLLPKQPNIHYLGAKPYEELPRYLAGWDVAMLPFALNEATRRSSPSQPLEYLAATIPTISTPIPDVIRRFGDAGPVVIAEWPAEWAWAIEDLLNGSPARSAEWLGEAERAVASSSWASVWQEMRSLVDGAIAMRRAALSDERTRAS